MKFSIVLIFILFLISCKSSEEKPDYKHKIHKDKSPLSSQKNKITKAKDFAFLTDSLNINEQLVKNNLPGFSLVVFENFEIVYTNHWGIKSVNTGEKIDKHTAFSTASIAKPITALLCLVLEEKGLINLDEPIDNYLKRWHLPNSTFTEKKKPTWKNFLNHTAGTSQHGFADYYEGDTIPTIKQSLLGQIPRYDREIEFLFTPGESWSYSGGGYVIIQMALEDHFDTPIAQLAEKYIFQLLSLTNTTMYQPNEKEFLRNVALVHDDEGRVIKTGLPITPQVAPSGLWSTPTDLAKLTIEIQKALRNESKLISNSVAKKLTDVSALRDAVGGWSYGWQRSFGFNNYHWFTHNGSNTGVGGDIFATMTDGNGFVFLANGEKKNRFPVIDHTRIKLLNILEWNREIPEDQKQEIPGDLKRCLIGSHEDFLYGMGFETKIAERNNRLYIESPFFEEFLGRRESELIFLKSGLFKVVDYPNILEFSCEDDSLRAVVATEGNLRFETKLLLK